MRGAALVLSCGGTVIPYLLFTSARKSLEIAVYPDRTVVVKAPVRASPAAVEKRMKKRLRWILRQLRHFEQFEPRTPPRRYVSGETHRYLGRSYRLKVHRGSGGRSRAALHGGYLHLYCGRGEGSAQKTLEDWYASRAREHFSFVWDECWRRFGAAKEDRPELKIRTMKTRWGSLSKNGRLTLNTRLILAPKSCIEYVVVHEMCHLTHPRHDAAFYRLLERRMPDWELRKRRLELTTAEHPPPKPRHISLTQP